MKTAKVSNESRQKLTGEMNDYASVNEALRKLKENAKFAGGMRPAFVEHDVSYRGESTSAFSFFESFPNVILRYYGSVLPHIFFEVFFAVACGVLASAMSRGGFFFPNGGGGDDDEEEDDDIVGEREDGRDSCDSSPWCIKEAQFEGFAAISVLLAFLLVFRSNISWDLYKEGHDLVEELCGTCRTLNMEVLTVAYRRANRAELWPSEQRADHRAMTKEQKNADRLAMLTFEHTRLLKLYFFAVVEDCRSDDGYEAWELAHEMACSLMSKAEKAEMLEDFGPPQAFERSDVLLGTAGEVAHRSRDDGEVARAKSADGKGGSWKKRGKKCDLVDPTRNKATMVLLWLRMNLSQILATGAWGDKANCLPTEVACNVEKLGRVGSMMSEVNVFGLPLPYAQLVKVFLLFIVFCTPFVYAPKLGPFWTPLVAGFQAIGFYGLDQVATSIEAPYGVDAVDFALLTIGGDLSEAMDSQQRTIQRHHVARRDNENLLASGIANERYFGWGPRGPSDSVSAKIAWRVLTMRAPTSAKGAMSSTHRSDSSSGNGGGSGNAGSSTMPKTTDSGSLQKLPPAPERYASVDRGAAGEAPHTDRNRVAANNNVPNGRDARLTAEYAASELLSGVGKKNGAKFPNKGSAV